MRKGCCFKPLGGSGGRMCLVGCEAGTRLSARSDHSPVLRVFLPRFSSEDGDPDVLVTGQVPSMARRVGDAQRT